MRVAPRWSEIMVLVAVVALPLKAGGCGSSACITVTPAQLAGGACPSMDVAKARLVATCPASIVDVSGPGTLDGNLCCYPVDTRSQNTGFDPCALGDLGDLGVGGSGTGSGGVPVCSTCLAALNGVDPSQLCPGAESFFEDVVSCFCAAGETCAGVCADSLCGGTAVLGACTSCVESSTQCAAVVGTCENN
jgi:hypothetical protein